MEEKHRKHIRLRGYDYGSNGYYFVTICAHNRESLFVAAPSYGAGKSAFVAAPSYGAGKSAFVAAPSYGAGKSFKQIVEEKLNQIGEYYKGVTLDYYAIMPNHIHLILVFEDAQTSLPKVINALKSWVTRDVKKYSASQGDAATRHIWQPNYYEHVIRNEKALAKIREYIENNPMAEKLNWDELDEG